MSMFDKVKSFINKFYHVITLPFYRSCNFCQRKLHTNLHFCQLEVFLEYLHFIGKEWITSTFKLIPNIKNLIVIKWISVPWNKHLDPKIIPHRIKNTSYPIE